jgi:hypothetical protein
MDVVQILEMIYCAIFRFTSRLGAYEEAPGLKPLFLVTLFQWPEGHCSLRHAYGSFSLA